MSRMTRNVLSGFVGLLFALMVVGWAALFFQRSDTNRDFAIQICEANNEQNAKQIHLWEGIIALSSDDADSDESPEERRRQLAVFRQLLTDTFQQHDCAAAFESDPVLGPTDDP